ncbi:3-oxoacyl-[acyl-carrier-protein] synthase II [Streptosporangium becharense]|uniref:3-oxoacyl-[acyl-carrier-protein] synthase II n=1 Tax=Streptosporangium becharense TaxID=1816182 RepID=A0A7W9ILT6_9ACTN|nr:beta-ketoacyl-[acyl-carrier-protein] synthase family protein [Streptosporangium becharense]MBB2910233.1 3-oxoacyl-[acyl-carrier-protein] synthase II [Streptosporangium becharense]MBB5822976.1 3-oxoacyl-[acyl-carrier-protein] synthase II [Streptosporangium becharense]
MTGLGVVTADGDGHEVFWRSLFTPPPPGHRTMADWDPAPWLGPRETRVLDRFTQFAVAAADLALRDAGRPVSDPTRSGVLVATALAGMATVERQAVALRERGERRVSPHFVPMFMPNAAPAAVSMRNGWRGPCETIQTACAAATHAIGRAAKLIANGECDLMLAGGTEAAATPLVVAGFTNMRALSSTRRLRPFDGERDGFVIAEGAALLVLEERDAATARGARIYGEVMGLGSTADAHDITAPRSDGAGAAECMRLALRDAGVEPAAVRQINAHGTGTLLNDAAEARAVSAVFGPETPPVTSTKGATGHAFGAGGALEAVAVLLSMRHRVIPPTIGLEKVDPEMSLDVVTGSGRAWAPGPALSNSFGFGGHNGCLVLGPGGEP